MSDNGFQLYGTSETEPESRILTAGPLAVTLQDGNLRTLRFRGHEVLRAVSFLVRDKDWGTCAADIIGLAVDAGTDSFSVRYKARFTAPDGANLDCTPQQLHQFAAMGSALASVLDDLLAMLLVKDFL